MNIVFFDIDGTLLVEDTNQIPESAKNGIKQLQKNGDLVFINTGRCRAQVYRNIVELGCDGYICSDGIYIEYKGKVLKNQAIDTELVQNIYDFLAENKTPFMVESQKAVWVSGDYNPKMLKILGKENFEKFARNFPDQIVMQTVPVDSVGKINFFICENEKNVYEKLCQNFSGKTHISTWPFFDGKTMVCSIGMNGSDKANGIKFLLDYLKLSDVKTFSFGDADGDIGMIKFCDTGIAMKNGTEKLKKCADYITDYGENDGIAAALKHFNLI